MGALANLLTGRLPKINTSYGVGLSSPMGGPATSIHELVWADFFQGEIAESTRSAAMQIPAISRARNVLVSVVAPLPLRAYDAAEVAQADLEGRDPVPLSEQPKWLTSTSGPTPTFHRMTWTLDDLLFSGASLWFVKRENGVVVDAARVQRDRWEIDPTNDEILVDSAPVSDDQVLYIPAVDEGLLMKGGPSIKGARAIERAWVGRVQNPLPLIVLHGTEDTQIEDDEIDELVDTWSAARTSPTGAVGWLPAGVNLETPGSSGSDDAALFVGARNASVLDLARHTNMPAAILDGSMSTSTLTYSTEEGKQNDFWAFTVPAYTSPIEARLSQDDVCPEGVAIRFDRTSAIRLPQPVTSPVTDD